MERAAAGTPGALYVGRLLYVNETAYPKQIEIAVLLPGAPLRVEQFDNRPGESGLNRPSNIPWLRLLGRFSPREVLALS